MFGASKAFSSLSLHDRRIIVAIDFGTTYSGVAWAKVLDGIPALVSEWPSVNGSPTGDSSDKVPTQILYDKDEPSGFKWGAQIPNNVERHQWFKLDLDSQYNPSSELSRRYPHPKTLPPSVHHTAEELTADYLKALKAHLLYMLQRALGEIQAKETPLQFILTVPAVWTEIAKEKTLKAAEKAGLGLTAPILMISEPEAAATYALQRQDLHFLSIGDTFVVCDAGGGTVDLISYTVVKKTPVLEVKEAAPGSGALCGSTYLNRRFQEFLEKKLGQEPGWDNETLEEAMDRFETLIKPSYSTTLPAHIYFVPVPGLANNLALGIKRGKLQLSSEDVKEILKPVTDESVKLVLNQIKATGGEVKGILLVGGFGRSTYLRERLEEAVNKKIEVIQPAYGWSAVVQGALMRGLADCDGKYSKVRLASRVARKHVGILAGTEFDADIHCESRKYWDGFDGRWNTRAMNWFIKKGDPVKEETPYTFHYVKQWPEYKDIPETCTSTIYCDRTDRPAMVYRDDEVLELVKLAVNTDDLPESAFEMKTGKDGELYNRLFYSIEVTYQSASTKFVLLHKGKRYGEVPSEYV